MKDVPLVTIGIVSYNRLLYLRALIESARRCICYPNIEWIIVDGNSVEPGLREYIEGLDFVQHKIFMDCTHAEAMNQIVKMAQGSHLMLLPEDVQFIVRGNWLADLVEVVSANLSIGHICFDAQRRSTLSRLFGRSCINLFSRQFFVPYTKRRYNVYKTASGRRFLGFGNTRIAIAPAGIMSFGLTDLLRRLGPWIVTKEKGTVANDSSLGAEDYMVANYLRSNLGLELVVTQIPLAADVVTDPRGTKAKVRGGNRRYGRYLKAPEGTIYYKIWEDPELARNDDKPVCFEDVVRPIGFNLPVDGNGNLLKNSVICADEPYELIKSS